MTEHEVVDGTTQGGAHADRARVARRRVARVIGVSLLALGLATGVGVAVVYDRWNANLNTVDLGAQVKNRPEKVVEGPVNILVMGDDTRVGNQVDDEEGGGSDTTILFHLSADRDFAYGISIPRDTAVMRPECYEKDGTPIPASDGYVKWNDAFVTGGPACTVQQVEQLTGVPVDNYVVVDFNGFKDMVDALGGVEVCIPEDIVDTEHGITLEAGTREISGDEALSYVRVRDVGDGTDLQRIKRQQTFISSMISEALGADMLARPDRLFRFLDAAMGSMTTDFENVAELAELAGQFNGIGLDNIAFVTTPWVYSDDKVSGGVEWTPEVEELWQLVINDRPLTEEFLDDAVSAAVNPDGSTAAPSSTATDGPASPGSPAGTTPPSGQPGAAPSDGPGVGLDEDERADASLC